MFSTGIKISNVKKTTELYDRFLAQKILVLIWMICLVKRYSYLYFAFVDTVIDGERT